MSVPILTACAGFLLAVLWMDLMFDSQAGLLVPRPDEDAIATNIRYSPRAYPPTPPTGTLDAGLIAPALHTHGAGPRAGDTHGGG